MILGNSFPNKRGRTYSRPVAGTGMPMTRRFQHTPVGACLERCLSFGNYQFRYGQQPDGYANLLWVSFSLQCPPLGGV